MHHAPPQPTSPEERARKLFRSHARIKGQAVWIWHIPSNNVWFSEEWRHMTLYPDDPTLERDVTRWFPERMHEDDVNPFLEMARDIVEGVTEGYQTLFRLKRRDGTWVWLLSRGSVTEKEDGKPVYVTGMVTDISFLRMDVKFQHGSGLLNAMLEYSPDQIVRMGELFPLYMNPAVFRYICRNRDTFDGVGNTVELGLDPEYLEFLQKNVERVFEEGKALKEQITFATPYGHTVTGEYSFWPEFNAQGEVVATMTQFQDVTDQLLAERNARLNEMRLDALYHLTRMDEAPVEEILRFAIASLVKITGSQSGLLFFPADQPYRKGDIAWSDDLLAEYGNALPKHVTAQSLAALLGVDRHLEPRLRRIRNGNNLQPVCKPFKGKMTVLRYMAAPVVENGRMMCFASVCNKDTEYKEADLQQLEAFISGVWFVLRRHEFIRNLQQAKEQAEAATKAMSEFLVNVNHELRTPLTSILGYAETLVQLDPEEEPFRNRCIDVIRDQADQMHKLVLDLLNLSRIEGTLSLNPSMFRLRDLVAEVERSLRKELKGKKLSLNISMPPGLRVNADRHFLAQVFRNLIENAARYAKEETEIEVRAARQEEGVQLSIIDQGAAIDPSETERIFERFYRGKQPAGAAQASGTGVGLSICKHVVERHGGKIWAENTGSGAAFRFTLPSA